MYSLKLQAEVRRLQQVSPLNNGWYIFTNVLTEVVGRGQETATSKYLTMDGNVLTADRGQETAISKSA